MEIKETPSNISTIQKKPQELAAQMISVYGLNLEFTRHPSGKELNEKYTQAKKRVSDLLESGIDDISLGDELNRIYENGIKLGIYAPEKGQNADEFLESAKQYYFGWGYDEQEAVVEAKKLINNQGYLADLRKWRRSHENQINALFNKQNTERSLSEESEGARILELKKRCLYVGKPENASILSEEFPEGNFLYHGTQVEQAINILNSGELLNAKTIWEREEEKAKAEGRERKFFKRNSGYEGISWSFNRITAMPGDRHHLVGFLASPQSVLSESIQLAIPSRPAPNEIISIDSEIDAKRYYEAKTQQELLLYFSIGESNSVWSNIVSLSSYRENQEAEIKNSYTNESMLNNFINRDISDEQMVVLLRDKFSVRENGTIELSSELLQQIGNEIPVGAVWLQSIIDTGRIKNIAGFEDVTSVRQVVERINKENYKSFLPEIKKDYSYIQELVKTEDDKVGVISVPTSELYFVVPDTDLSRWIKLLARCESVPKGIVVYRHTAVRMENFASLHHGDDEAMTSELRFVIPASETTIDYEGQLLEEKITSDKLAGYRHHVIGEQYLKNRKSIKKNHQGDLFIS